MASMSKNECNEQEVQGWIKWGDYWKLFSFVVGSCERFQNFGDHKNMNANRAIEKLQIITKEKEVQKSEQRWKQDEEVKLLKEKEKKKEC